MKDPRAPKRSVVSIDNAETISDYNGGLELTNADDFLPGDLKNTENVMDVSSPIHQSSQGLSPTAIVVTTKPSTGKVDKGLF